MYVSRSAALCSSPFPDLLKHPRKGSSLYSRSTASAKCPIVRCRSCQHSRCSHRSVLLRNNMADIFRCLQTRQFIRHTHAL